MKPITVISWQRKRLHDHLTRSNGPAARGRSRIDPEVVPPKSSILEDRGHLSSCVESRATPHAAGGAELWVFRKAPEHRRRRKHGRCHRRIGGGWLETRTVSVVGRTSEVKERFYAISVERRITHPAVRAISEAARSKLFSDGTR